MDNAFQTSISTLNYHYCGVVLKGMNGKQNLDILERAHWCQYCAGNAKLTLANTKQIAIKNGGLYVSGKYINNNSLLLWQCAERHKWNASYSNVKSKRWCPYCSNKYMRENLCREIKIPSKIRRPDFLKTSED